MPNLIVCQFDTLRIAEYADLASYSKMEWCGRHRVAYSRATLDDKHLEVAAPWYKIAMLSSVFQHMQDGDVAWMTDADLCITNMVVPPPTNNDFKHIRLWHDGFCLNTGSFLLRKTDQSKKLLESVWLERFRQYPLWEQDAIVARENDPDLAMDVIREGCWNANIYANKWQDGDFTCHLTGCSGVARYKMAEYMARTVR